MALKLKREVVVRSKFLARKDSLTGEIISVIAPNGLQVGLSGSNSVSAEFNSYGKSKFYEGLSGSLTQLTDGTSYLVAGSNMTVTSASNGQVILAAASGGSTSPGGSDTQIQYNDGGSFGGVASMTFDDSSGHLTIIDDKKLQFGTGNDASIEYDEDGNDVLLINGAATKFTVAGVEIENASDSGAAALTIDNDDVDKIALDIDAANTTAHVVDITADALTTGLGVNITSDSPDNSSRTLLKVLNDNSSATGTSAASFETHAVQTCVSINNDNTETNFGPILTVNRKSSTVADDMGAGLINFQGLTDGGNLTGYARISAEASDVTDATPQGKLVLRAQLNIDGSEPNAVEELMSLGGGVGADGAGASVVINDLSYDVDFRVESDSETHMLFVDSGNNRVSIGDSTDAPAATLEITNHASAGATGVPLLQLNNNDVDEEALQIVAANTTGNVLGITADSLTTGKGIVLYSNSSSGSERDLMRIRNDNTGADATTLLRLMNDADPDDTPEGATMVIEHNFNTNNRNNLALTSNGATGTTCAALALQKSTTSEADDGFLGIIRFQGMNSNNDLHEYASIVGITSDVTDGDEGGLIKLFVHAGGTAGTADFKELLNIGGEDVVNGKVPAVVVNEDGINCDFRVESDAEDEAIFLDASAETLYINKGESDFTTQIHSTNDVAMTVGAAGAIFNEDGHATNDFRVESDNNTHMLFVDAGDDTVTVGADDSLHKDGFAVINDYQGTTFENKLADGEFGSGEILKFSPGANDTLTAGQLFFLNADGTWDQTDADAVATGADQLLGVGLGGSSQTVGCLIRGFIRIPSTEILNTPGSPHGKPIYVSTTAGHFDFTAPSGNNDFVRIVGYAIDKHSSDVLIYFNPDGTFVEIA